ncbi:MAG: Lipopolysaccharide export system permease protein LptG, partial [uncultured Sphingomonadaceae bacterium]
APELLPFAPDQLLHGAHVPAADPGGPRGPGARAAGARPARPVGQGAGLPRQRPGRAAALRGAPPASARRALSALFCAAWHPDHARHLEPELGGDRDEGGGHLSPPDPRAAGGGEPGRRGGVLFLQRSGGGPRDAAAERLGRARFRPRAARRERRRARLGHERRGPSRGRARDRSRRGHRARGRGNPPTRRRHADGAHHRGARRPRGRRLALDGRDPLRPRHGRAHPAAEPAHLGRRRAAPVHLFRCRSRRARLPRLAPRHRRPEDRRPADAGVGGGVVAQAVGPVVRRADALARGRRGLRPRPLRPAVRPRGDRHGIGLRLFRRRQLRARHGQSRRLPAAARRLGAVRAVPAHRRSGADPDGGV